MKLQNLLKTPLLLLAGLAGLTAEGFAATTTYTNGDLFLGFRVTGGTGVASDYLVNIGSPAQLNQSGPVAVGNIAADLSNLYGPDWYGRTDLFYAVVGGSVTDNTLYATRVSFTPWNRYFVQGDFSSLTDSLGTNYAGKTSTAGNPLGLIQAVAGDNSYASFQPGGTFPNSGGISFSAWAPTIEGTAADTLYLNRLAEGSNGAGTIVGNFSLASDGTLTFTAGAVMATPKVHFQSTQYSVSEDEAAGEVTVTLAREGALATPFTVNLSTVDGTALGGVDYTAQSNAVVNFGAGQTTATTTVRIMNRDGYQGPRSFNVSLSGPTAGATVVAPSTATIQIAEVDPAPAGSVSFTSATFQGAESPSGDATLTITAERSVDQVGAISVDVVVASGGTASEGADFNLPSTPVTLSWADGESGSKTFLFTIKSDALAEGAETAILQLQNIQGGAALGSISSATVTIVDADLTLPTVKILSPEAGAVITGKKVTISGNARDNKGVARVELRLNGGTARILTPAVATTNFNWSVTLVPEQGLNTIQVIAFDLQNNASAAKTRSFRFTNLRPALAGEYNGLITAAAAGSVLRDNGLVSVTVTKTGSFTGQVKLAGAKVSISGVFQTAGQAGFGSPVTFSRHLLTDSNVDLGYLSLQIDTGTGQVITGSISDSATPGGTLLASISNADRAAYSALSNPVPAKLRGKYTTIFQANTAPNNGVTAAGYPQGDGWGRLSVNAGGVVTIVGKLADGSSISYSNKLSKKNEWPVFVTLYDKAGLITGSVAFDPTQTQSDASGAGMRWFKPAALAGQTLYPAGWPAGIATDFVASKYYAPAKPTASQPHPRNPDTVLGVGAKAALNASTANVVLTLNDGGLGAGTSNEGSMNANSKVTVLGASSGATGATLLMPTFATTTGALTGSFTHPEGGTVTFSGIAYQKTKTASGFFIYTPSATAPAGTVAESGGVGVASK